MGSWGREFEAARFECKRSNRRFMFNLQAANGQIVGTSGRYDNERACENRVEPVAGKMPRATVEGLGR